MEAFPLCLCRIFPESLRWLMATQQFESAKKLILYITQKNCVSPESDIKGVMPGKYTMADQGAWGLVLSRIPVLASVWSMFLCPHGLQRFGTTAVAAEVWEWKSTKILSTLGAGFLHNQVNTLITFFRAHTKPEAGCEMDVYPIFIRRIQLCDTQHLLLWQPTIFKVLAQGVDDVSDLSSWVWSFKGCHYLFMAMTYLLVKGRNGNINYFCRVVQVHRILVNQGISIR